jgi:hypothetical protein|tara:strand:+ start:495 stop:677 length:183 start_codon:yes stop_codon:yes gene_type:complete
MNQKIEQELKPYKYSLEVGHSKSGSDHVVVIKSLKVRGDDLGEALAELKAALQAFKELTL